YGDPKRPPAIHAGLPSAVGRGSQQGLEVAFASLCTDEGVSSEYAQGGPVLRRALQVLLVISLASGAVWAANDTFVGEWKLNTSKSKLTDQMKVESVANDKYAFDFGGGSAETIVPDGTDQPGLAGTTLSITIQGPDAWKVIRKQQGRILLT